MGDHVPDGSDECAPDPDLTTRDRCGRRGSGGVHPVDGSQLPLIHMPKRYRRGRQTLIRTDSAARSRGIRRHPEAALKSSACAGSAHVTRTVLTSQCQTSQVIRPALVSQMCSHVSDAS